MKKNTIFIIIAVIIIASLAIIAFTVDQEESKKPKKEDLLKINYDVEGNEATLNYNKENPIVAMYIEGYGSIVMELYPDTAPNTVNNFIALVKSGFYDNNTFHRLVPGFVLQGGDPTGTGAGGPGYNIKGEFSENGFKNNLSHKKGIVSMARSQENDTAGSQFFICIEDATSINGLYAAFGKVIDGWKNIEAIIENEKIANTTTGKLEKNLTIKKALIDLKGKEYQEVEKINEKEEESR